MDQEIADLYQKIVETTGNSPVSSNEAPKPFFNGEPANADSNGRASAENPNPNEKPIETYEYEDPAPSPVSSLSEELKNTRVSAPPKTDDSFSDGVRI